MYHVFLNRFFYYQGILEGFSELYWALPKIQLRCSDNINTSTI